MQNITGSFLEEIVSVVIDSFLLLFMCVCGYLYTLVFPAL